MLMRRANLMTEDAASAPLGIDLRIVNACKIIKSHLSISIQNQHRQQHALIEVFDQQIERMPVVFCIKSEYR